MKILPLNSEHSTDTHLWNGIISNDESAFSELFEKYYPSLVSYGNSLMPFSERVKDCVQDVFVDIWVYRTNLNKSVVVKAYLLSCVRKRIARLHERDYIFRQSSEISSVEFLLNFSLEKDDDYDEVMFLKLTQLNQLLNALPARQKEALYLRYHQNLSIEQISEMLDVNYQSTKNLLHRAILNIRKDWQTHSVLIFLVLSKIC